MSNSDYSATELQEQLEKVLGSKQFQRSPRLSPFLKYVVEETLAGKGDLLKGFNIALDVFGRDVSFDSSTDPLVRVQARNLRLALERYYLDDGKYDPIRIDIPKGFYSATFSKNSPEQQVLLEPSIAVLPFEAIGGPDQRSYLAEGITYELNSAFTQFAELAVVIRQAVESYRRVPVDVRKVSRELGVRFVLQGSVQTVDDNIRVSARLLDGPTGNHLWARDYNRKLTTHNMFEVQDEITREVVSRITGTYGVIQQTLEKETRGRRPEKLTVYEAILRFYSYNVIMSQVSYDDARKALELAVVKEPDLALAWALLAEMYTDGYSLGFAEDKEPLVIAAEYAQRAITLDPNCQHAHWEMAQVRFHRRDQQGCLQSLEKVLFLNPNAAFFVGAAGWLMALVGEWERGLAILQESISLNPHQPGWFYLAPFQDCFRRGDYEGARENALNFSMARLAWDQILRAASHQRLGNTEAASRAVAELLKHHPDFPARADTYVSRFVFFSSITDDILAALQEAGLPKR